MAAAMNCDLHLTDKLNVFHQEVKRLEIEVIPPCVNRGQALFSVVDGKIAYALGGLKNVGAEAMRLITDARAEGGEFEDLFDFARRVDLKRVGKRPMEMLARAGGFDLLDGNRRKCLESVDQLVAYSAATHEDRNSAQGGLFGDAEIPFGLKLPAFTNKAGWRLTSKLGTFAGRAVPILGWGLLAADIASVVNCTSNCVDEGADSRSQ